ncbi:TRAP transporter small permease [Vreelandella sp. EE27]
MFARQLTCRLARFCEVSAAVIFIIVCLLNFGQVFSRYILGSSFGWAEEIMRYSMPWIMMLGGTAAIYRGEHMAVDAVPDMFSGRLQHIVRSLLYGVAMIFCMLLVLYGWPAALANTRQSAAASGLPMVVPYMALPIGGALMIVQITLCWITGFDQHTSEKEPI